MQNDNSTRCSQAVTHPSTNRAQRCLTSVIGRELVFSTWYGRCRKSSFNHWLQIGKFSIHKKWEDIFRLSDAEIPVLYELLNNRISHGEAEKLKVLESCIWHIENFGWKIEFLLQGTISAYLNSNFKLLKIFTLIQNWKFSFIFSTTAIPRWKHQFSSDHWS